VVVLAFLLHQAWGQANFHQCVTVATGLRNPRGVTVDNSNRIFVAEEGALPTTDFCIIDGPAGPECYATTGRVSQVQRSGSTTSITGVGSLVTPAGTALGGPTDVAINGNYMFVTVGAGLTFPEHQSVITHDPRFGTLLVFEKHGNMWNGPINSVNLWSLEANNDWDHNGIRESNPAALAISDNRIAVVDSAANVIYVGSVQGSVVGPLRALATLPALPTPGGGPPPTYDALPTSIVRAPAGNGWLVSQLTGYPFPAGLSNIYFISDDGTVSVYATGLTTVTGITVDRDGNVWAVGNSPYVLPSTPKLWKITPDRHVIECPTDCSFTFTFGIDIDLTGGLFISDAGFGDQGTLKRIIPDPAVC